MFIQKNRAKARLTDKDERYTPRWYVRRLNAKYAFTVDAASTPIAPAAEVITRFWTKAEDGLAMPWRGERVFCNPPFSRILAWVAKAHHEMVNGGANLIVFLLPSTRTEQPWWHRYVEPYRDGRSSIVNLATHFVRGRLRFGTPRDPDGRRKGSPPFPCLLLVWSRTNA